MLLYVEDVRFCYDDLMDAVYERNLQDKVSAMNIYTINKDAFGPEEPTYACDEVYVDMDVLEKLTDDEKIGKDIKSIINEAKKINADTVVFSF